MSEKDQQIAIGIERPLPGPLGDRVGNRTRHMKLPEPPQPDPAFLIPGFRSRDAYGAHTSHIAANPRNEKKPTTSVTVVTKTPDAVAGSMPK